jgi:FkbM family methyltransferase
VRLNSFTHVRVLQIALGSTPGRGALVFPSDEAARGSLERHIADDIRREKHVDAVEVEIDTVDRQLANGLPDPDFVKLDVEGLERDVLEGMRGLVERRRPSLYIEIHGADEQRKLENLTGVASFLWNHGYQVRHIESGMRLQNISDLPQAIRGHLYCT